MAKDKKRVGVHGTDEETGRAKANADKKKACSVTEDQFMEKAEPVVANISALGVSGVLTPKKFSSGSLGFFGNGKTVVTVDGKACEATFQMQVVLNNSKQETAEAAVE